MTPAFGAPVFWSMSITLRRRPWVGIDVRLHLLSVIAMCAPFRGSSVLSAGTVSVRGPREAACLSSPEGHAEFHRCGVRARESEPGLR